MSQPIEIKGQQEAIAILKEFETRDQKKFLLNVMRKALRPIPRDARARLGGYSSRVAKSIKIWQPRGASRKDNPRLFVGVKSNWRGYGDPKDPWFAHMIEYGSSGIKKKSRPAGSTGSNDESTPFRVRVANLQKGDRFREDQPARPFMQPAIAANQDRASRILTEEMSTHLQKTVNRKKRTR